LVPVNDNDHPCCSQDLPLELRTLPAGTGRGGAGTAQLVSGLTLTDLPDDVIARDLAFRGLLIPASGRAMTATSSPHH
jgi:hypothetical protein